MSFRLIVRLPGGRDGSGCGDCTRADEAFAMYRRLSKTRLQVEKILDLRSGHERQISAPELEAIAQRERCDLHKTSASKGGA